MAELEEENYFGKRIGANLNLILKVMRFAAVNANVAITHEEFYELFGKALDRIGYELRKEKDVVDQLVGTL